MASSFQRMSRFCSFLAVLSLVFMATSAQALSVGDVAPDFEAPRLTDDTLAHLSSYRGKVVYVEFWASWCPPCWDALPLLEKMHKELQEEGLEVIGVNIDDELADATKSTQKLGVSFTMVRPEDVEVKRAYNVTQMPYGVLIDRQGVVRYTYTGLSKSKLVELKKKIRRLLWTGL